MLKYSFFASHFDPGWYCQNMARFDISPGGSLISLSCLQGALVTAGCSGDVELFSGARLVHLSAEGIKHSGGHSDECT